MDKKIAQVTSGLTTLTATAFYYATAFAAGAESLPQAVRTNVESLAFTIINYILGAAGLVAVVYLIIGGFNYITSGGNEETTKKAVRTLLNAVIGLVVIFAAYAIVVTVQRVVFGNTPIPGGVITGS